MSEAAAGLAGDYDAVMAEVIEAARSCSDADWATVSAGEQRTVGVLFDHIARGNPQVVEWIETFLAGRPIPLTREELDARNAGHARRAASRPRHETIEDLESSSRSTSGALRALTDEQLAATQTFGWAGEQNVAWVAAAAVRHPRGHLKSIREALGR